MFFSRYVFIWPEAKEIEACKAISIYFQIVFVAPASTGVSGCEGGLGSSSSPQNSTCVAGKSRPPSFDAVFPSAKHAGNQGVR